MRKRVMGLMAVALLATVGPAISQENSSESVPPAVPPAKAPPIELIKAEVVFEPAAYEAFEQWAAQLDPAELAARAEFPSEQHARFVQAFNNTIRRHDPPETRGAALYVRFPVYERLEDGDHLKAGELKDFLRFFFVNESIRDEARRQLTDTEKSLAEAEKRVAELKQNPLLAAMVPGDDDRVTALLQTTEKDLAQVLVEAAGTQARVETLRRHLADLDARLKQAESIWSGKGQQSPVEHQEQAREGKAPIGPSQPGLSMDMLVGAQAPEQIIRLQGGLMDAETAYAEVEGKRKQLVENQQALMAFRAASLEQRDSSRRANGLRAIADSTGDVPRVAGVIVELPWKPPRLVD